MNMTFVPSDAAQGPPSSVAPSAAQKSAPLLPFEGKRGMLIFCQVADCGRDLKEEKDYYRRYKVCLKHATSPEVTVRDISQRFCQQCGTFHPVPEFDADKRSCRHALSLHNLKRRKKGPGAEGAGISRKQSANWQRRDQPYHTAQYEQHRIAHASRLFHAEQQRAMLKHQAAFMQHMPHWPELAQHAQHAQFAQLAMMQQSMAAAVAAAGGMQLGAPSSQMPSQYRANSALQMGHDHSPAMMQSLTARFVPDTAEDAAQRMAIQAGSQQRAPPLDILSEESGWLDSMASTQGRLPDPQGPPISTQQLQAGGPGSAHLAAAMQLLKQSNDMELAKADVHRQYEAQSLPAVGLSSSFAGASGQWQAAEGAAQDGAAADPSSGVGGGAFSSVEAAAAALTRGGGLSNWSDEQLAATLRGAHGDIVGNRGSSVGVSTQELGPPELQLPAAAKDPASVEAGTSHAQQQLPRQPAHQEQQAADAQLEVSHSGRAAAWGSGPGTPQPEVLEEAAKPVAQESLRQVAASLSLTTVENLNRASAFRRYVRPPGEYPASNTAEVVAKPSMSSGSQDTI